MKARSIANQIRILLYPDDFARTRQFYAQLVQWPIHREWDYGDSKGVMFDTGGGIIELLWPQPRTPCPKQLQVSFRIDDVWSFWKEIGNQAPIVFPLRENSWGDDSFCISDPDGMRLTFFTDRPN